MKTLTATVVGTVLLLATEVALAQNMTMMNGRSPGTGWMDGAGGYGGTALPILLVIAAIALIVWVVRRDEN